MPSAPRGGQHSPPKLDQPITIDTSKLTPADLAKLKGSPPGEVKYVADRIATPDGVNVAEVLKATAQAEREKQVLRARRERHMSDCQVHRSDDCNCPANLAQLPKALETFLMGPGQPAWIRVDEAHHKTLLVPHPGEHRGRLIEKQVLVLPRWICTGCGLAQRVVSPGGHLCDPSYVIFKDKPVPLSLTVPVEKRFAGAYRLTLWRDTEGQFHLGELVIEAGQVVSDNEVLVEGDFPALEGAISDLLLQEFSP